MYKISEQAKNAFFSGGKFSAQNTHVEDFKFYLWGNKIFWRDSYTGNFCFSMCGWDTRTTAERLRALGVKIYHKRGKLQAWGHDISDCACYMIVGEIDAGVIVQL